MCVSVVCVCVCVCVCVLERLEKRLILKVLRITRTRFNFVISMLDSSVYLELRVIS